MYFKIFIIEINFPDRIILFWHTYNIFLHTLSDSIRLYSPYLNLGFYNAPFEKLSSFFLKYWSIIGLKVLESLFISAFLEHLPRMRLLANRLIALLTVSLPYFFLKLVDVDPNKRSLVIWHCMICFSHCKFLSSCPRIVLSSTCIPLSFGCILLDCSHRCPHSVLKLSS